MKPQTNVNDLQQALNFSDDDLNANRNGALSEMQMYQLRVQRRRGIFTGVLILLVVALIATLFIFFGGQNDSPILTVIGIGITLCNAALTGIFGRYWLRLTGDIRRGEVNALQGELVRVVKPVTRRVANTLIRIDEVELLVNRTTFDAFQHKQRYILYRAPYTGILLSAERV